MPWVDNITVILDRHTLVELVKYLGKHNKKDAI
jgi:hypothetical protein